MSQGSSRTRWVSSNFMEKIIPYLPLSLIKSTQKSDEIYYTMLHFSYLPETVTQTNSNKDSVSLNSETLSSLDTQHV